MKIVLRILNLIYLALAGIACFSLATRPLLSIESNLVIDKESIASVIPEDIKNELPDGNVDGVITNDVSLEFKIEIPAKLGLSLNQSEYVADELRGVINDFVSDVVTSVKPAIHDLAEAIAKTAASKVIKDEIANSIKDIIGVDADTQAKMEEAGINAEYIADFTNDIYDALAEGGTVENLVDTVSEKIEDVYAKLAEIDPEQFNAEANFTEELKEQIEDSLKEALNSAGLCDEEGNLKPLNEAIDDLLLTLLDQAMGGTSGSEEAPETEPKSRALVVMAEGEVEDAEDKLAAKLVEFVNSFLDKMNINEALKSANIALFVVVALNAAPWLLFALLTIFRTIRRKKCWVRPWYLFVLAGAQLIFGLVLTFATARVMPLIAEAFQIKDGILGSLLLKSTFSIKTLCYVPSIILAGLIPFSIIYAIFRMIARKQYKKEKAEAKAA